MHLMLEQDEPADFVVGTGVTHSVEELVSRAFAAAGLDWREHVVSDTAFVRLAEVDHLCADPSKVAKELGWEPTVGFDELVTMMVESDLALLSGPEAHHDESSGLKAGEFCRDDGRGGRGPGSDPGADRVADQVRQAGGDSTQQKLAEGRRGRRGRSVSLATRPPPMNAASAARPSASASESRPAR